LWESEAPLRIVKVVFGYLIMKLVDDHTLDLDKPVYAYFPGRFPNTLPNATSRTMYVIS
jgi:CubicO group peptidase (beta-lactamase class C family)